MAETQRAIAFSSRLRDAATALEIAYRRAKRLSEEWYALGMGSDIPFDTNLFEDGWASMPMTHMDVYGVVNRADELVADYEANNHAKLNTILKASHPPGDWR